MFVVVVEWLQKKKLPLTTWDEHSAGTSEGAALIGHDDDNTKEEEVYQDLCSIQNGVRSQVFMLGSVKRYLIEIAKQWFSNPKQNDLHSVL